MATRATSPDGNVSRNLNGQKLGRKGRDTRARILAAAAELVREGDEQPITLSAVARRSSLGMTSLYLYFNDLTELLLAVLEPVSAMAEEAYISRLRTRWPDEELSDLCQGFVAAHHGFWARNSQILHLRNSMADAHDLRMMEHRIAAATPVITLLAAQMDIGDGDPQELSNIYGMASVLMTSLERVATIWTDTEMHRMLKMDGFTNTARMIGPAARLLELGIREGREMAHKAR